MQPAIFRLERFGELEVVATSGELDLSVADELAARLAALGEPLAAVSLEECSYIDSTILTVLIKATKARAGRLVVVLPVAHRLRRIFEIANVDRILHVVGSLDEAAAIQTHST